MPFTLAHPAAVVPLSRALPRRLVLSALITGSMIPDLAYVFPSNGILPRPHTTFSVFAWGMPVGLFALWFFHAAMKRPLVQLFPESLRERLVPYCGRFVFFPASRFTWVLFSLFVGISSHLVWDSMTKLRGWTVEHISFFREPMLTVAGHPTATFFFFKHFSTALGLILLAYWALRWIADGEAVDSRQTARRSRSWKTPAVVWLPLLAYLGGTLLVAVTTQLGYTRTSRFVLYAGMISSSLLVLYCVTCTITEWPRLECDAATGPPSDRRSPDR